MPNKNTPTVLHTRATRAQVAHAAGVSESTVSRALANSSLISSEVKRRVHEAASRLDYVASRQAAGFASSRTFHIGLVVRSYGSFAPFSRAYFPALLDGAVLGAEERGYRVTIVLDRLHTSAVDLVRVVRAHEVDGLLLSVTPGDDVRICALRESASALVLINNYLDGFSSVDARPEPGMRLAFDHALSLGHRRFGYITGDMHFKNATDRLDTFNALAREFAVETDVVQGDFSRRSGYIAAGRMLCAATRPTVIMTAADRAALGVLDYCHDHRVAVPGDVSVIGYDNFDPARDVTPRLTTVDNPVTMAGKAGAHILIDRIEGISNEPVQQWLPTGFVARESSGPCPGP